MVFSRGLVISLGVSALSATLLFLYFRNRISSVERKVDVMFDLIQSHEVDRQQMAQQQMMMAQQSAPVSSNTGAWTGEDNRPERDLIDVSEDDEEYETDDSKEVSDNEEDLEERIKLVTNDIDLEEENTQDVVVLESENTEPVTVDETVQLEEVTDDIDDNGSPANDHTTVQSAAVANESDDADEEDEAIDSLEDSDSEDEEDEEEEEEVQQVVQEVEYNKLKVSELKAIAEAKGLTNYKSLKKQPLIDLIKAAE